MKKIIPYILGYSLLAILFNYYSNSKSFPDDLFVLMLEFLAAFLYMAILPSLIYIFSKSFKAFKISYWVIFVIFSILTKGAHFMANYNPPNL